MNAITIFFYYYVISGIINFMWLYWAAQHSEENSEVEDLLTSATWQTGMNRESILIMLYVIGLLGGFVLLPLGLFDKIFGKEEK